MTEQEDAERELWIQRQIEQQEEDQQLYQEWKKDNRESEALEEEIACCEKCEERRELDPLECDHEFETVDRLDKDTVLQVCLVCDLERTLLKAK